MRGGVLTIMTMLNVWKQPDAQDGLPATALGFNPPDDSAACSEVAVCSFGLSSLVVYKEQDVGLEGFP